MSAQKVPQGSETNMGELLGGTDINSVSCWPPQYLIACARPALCGHGGTAAGNSRHSYAIFYLLQGLGQAIEPLPCNKKSEEGVHL